MSIALSPYQYGIIAGLAASGFATLITTYDAIAQPDSWENCTPVPDVDIQKKKQTKFLTVLIISILAVIAGMIIKILLDYQLYGYGLLTAGIVGITYALFSKLADVSIAVKTSISWISFLAFLALGFFSESTKS